MIRQAEAQDAQSIATIYNHYVLNTVVTFEEEAVTATEMSVRIQEVKTADLIWLVIENEGEVFGYAYASKWKGRCAYRRSVEITVYLAKNAARQGFGSRLYGALLSALREKSIHAVIGGIALPNQASIALHEKFGMQKVAHFSEIGFKFNRWIDVGYWQVLLK